MTHILTVFILAALIGCNSPTYTTASGENTWLSRQPEFIKKVRERQVRIYAKFLYDWKPYRLTCYHPEILDYSTLCMSGPTSGKACQHLIIVNEDNIEIVGSICEQHNI